MIEKIKQFMAEDEQILRQARIHWIVFAPSAIYCFIGLLAALFFHPLVGGVIFMLTLYPIYNAYIQYTMTYLILTNKKVLSRVGFLSRDWVRMDFNRIENAFLEEPIIGRYLGYSTVVVSGVGSGNVAVAAVADGDVFIQDLEKELTKNRGN